MMTGDRLGPAMGMGTETSAGRTVRDPDFTLLSRMGYSHSSATPFSKFCFNSTGENTHHFHCGLTSEELHY